MTDRHASVQLGRDEHWKYWLNDDKEALERAENRYHRALEFDSSFAYAYTGLADVYWDKYYWEEYFTQEFLDSFLILINIALSYDDQLAEAYRYRGYYSPKRQEIALATPEEKTFFHELAHAGHDRIKDCLKEGQDPFQEIVAELSAQALCRLVGKQDKDTTGNSFRYIERYANTVKMTAHTACLKVLSETEKVLNLILRGAHNEI